MAKHGGVRAGAGRPIANHTILVAEARKALIDAYMKEQVVIDAALVEKAKTGDVPAIKELYDRVYGKSLQTNENINVKKVRFDDAELQEINHDLIRVQKGENNRSARTGS